MEPKTKQYLLVTVVGVTLFVALLRLSAVLAFAADLVDLILPILAGGILALFLSVPMAGLEKRLRSLFRRAKKQPSGSAIHLLSFFITLLGVVLVLVLALTLLIPELVQSFHSLYLQIESNIPRWTAYLSAQDTNMDWLMHWLEGCIFCPDHLHLYVPRGRESLPPRPHTGMRLSEAQPRRRAAEILSAVPSVLRKLSDGTMQ